MWILIRARPRRLVTRGRSEFILGHFPLKALSASMPVLEQGPS